MPKKRRTTWILIADATRARILKNDGPGRGIEAVEGLVFRSEHRKLGEIMADRPGRVFESAGSLRHGLEYASDAVREDDRAFAKSLVSVLQNALGRKEYDRLVIVASNRMLGEIRAALPEKVKASVYAEIGKDLTQIPNSDLPKHLADILSI